MLRCRALVLAMIVGGFSACGDAPTAIEKVAAVDLKGLAVIQTAPVTSSNVRPWIGVIEAVNHATLSAQTSGQVTTLLVDVNDTVKAGDVLAHFSRVEQLSGQNRAQAALLAAQAQAIEADADYQRMREIYARRLIAKAQYDQALSKRDFTRAQLASAQAQLSESAQQLRYTIMRAPFDGVIAQRHVEVGEIIIPGQAIFDLHSPEQLRVKISLPAADAATLDQSKTAKVVLDGGVEIDVDNIVIFPDADPQSHTVLVRLGLPFQARGLKPGTIVKALLPSPGDQGLLIPVRSVVTRGELTSVFVVGANKIGVRQVRLGHLVGEQVQVLSGLNIGEVVAIDPIEASVRLAEMQAEK
jgi:RND family efflux transporter MFP subunit